MAPGKELSKLERLEEALEKGENEEALRIGASFKSTKPEVSRAWQALKNPNFYKELGKDPKVLVEEGIKVLKEYFVFLLTKRKKEISLPKF